MANANLPRFRCSFVCKNITFHVLCTLTFTCAIILDCIWYSCKFNAYNNLTKALHQGLKSKVFYTFLFSTKFVANCYPSAVIKANLYNFTFSVAQNSNIDCYFHFDGSTII